ncbi:hypothetical protein LCGC14_1321130 [marine sediment metagenome]|uniref:SF4 helicase domain-containing protein n=1 Tax=marine sediment metagenome TaxID=412755 RepID=A0A0F9NLV7_9ZZZZ
MTNSPNVGVPQSLDQILSQKMVYPRTLVGGGLLYESTKMIVYGRYKSLKSMLALDLAFSMVTGNDWLGFKTDDKGSSVLYLQLEISYPLFRSRLSKTWSWRKQYSEILKPLTFWTHHFLKLDQADGIRLLDHYLEQYHPDILILDPLYKVVSGNLLTVLDMQRIVDALDTMISKHQVSVILISHTRKGVMDMGEWGSDDLIGSFVFSAWADTVLKVERRGGDRLALKFDVVRHAEEELDPKEVVFNRDTLELTVVEPLITVPKETSSST